MTATKTPPSPEAEYYHIENALMATAKGRRFLRTYLERNRSVEVQKLLRSISRLHRATAGEPSFAANVYQDLLTVLSNMRKLREIENCKPLGTGLEQIEASLMALTEAVEERCFHSQQEFAKPASHDKNYVDGACRDDKLFSELASLFSEGPRLRSDPGALI